MTRISDRHYQEDNSNATIGDPTLSMADHSALLREAQCEVGLLFSKGQTSFERRALTMLKFMKIIAVAVLIVPLAATMALGQAVWTPTSDGMASRVESVTDQSAVIDIEATVPSQVLVWYGQTGNKCILRSDVRFGS